jgi:hypothetical protein
MLRLRRWRDVLPCRSLEELAQRRSIMFELTLTKYFKRAKIIDMGGLG